MAQGKNTSNRQLLVKAKDAESQGDAEGAIMLYQQAVKNNPREEQAWQRLMVLYRKKKDYEGELKVINLAFKTYETHTLKTQQEWLRQNKKVATLFKSLAKSLGLMNSKDVMVNDDPVLDKWRHRKEWVTARLKKRPKK
ncbi:tetratricopeptide repeat protein [Chitinophaga ginsengisoli]|uniref:Uncharacterized protein n=1 Tax=Chitinophaga ginsengisoli TaxID=363837 RepID=A0A2P8GM01_9BACT|nr:tetratricopeptide repeat protein [Chitinophaga ginsengisoli]PSL34994.1 hypothetical protein CLV42_102568 [Chitinophaga ginsengisoli]